MRIAFVKDAVYPWEKGGAQKRNWEVARRLADRHDVHIFGMHYWDGPSVIERDGVTFHGVCPPRELYTKNGSRSIGQALRFARDVFGPLQNADVDVIDCQKSSLFPFYTTKLSSLLNDTVLIGMWTEIWDDYWYEYLGWKGIFGKAVERTTVRLPDINIAISDFVADEMRSVGRKSGITVVHNGVDYTGIQSVAPSEESWDLLYVGRLSEHKNVELLIDAVDLLVNEMNTDLNCGIIGDGPERNALESKTRSLELTDCIEFLGFVEGDDTVTGHMKSASLFVLPSEREGFPNTILEANACGLPSIIVDADRNGGKAIVDDGETGFVVPKSATAIAEQIQIVLESPSKLKEMSAAADKYASKHDWSEIVRQTENVYTTAASR